VTRLLSLSSLPVPALHTTSSYLHKYAVEFIIYLTKAYSMTIPHVPRDFPTSFRFHWNQSLYQGRKLNILRTALFYFKSYHLMPSTTSNANEEMAMKQHTHLINLVRGMVPPLTSKLHKGQAGTFCPVPSRLGRELIDRSNWCTRWFGRVSHPQLSMSFSEHRERMRD